MNVRIVPRENLSRTDLYGGIRRIQATGAQLLLWHLDDDVTILPLTAVAEIQVDDFPGDW